MIGTNHIYTKRSNSVPYSPVHCIASHQVFSSNRLWEYSDHSKNLPPSEVCIPESITLNIENHVSQLYFNK